MAVLRLPEWAYLHECFAYSPKTGLLRWRRRPRKHFATQRAWNAWNADNAGKIAGSVFGNGRCYVGIAGKSWLVHRVIWKLATGKEPPAHMDHINCDPLDNRLANLRPATASQSQHNKRGWSGRTLPKDIRRTKNRWEVRIWLDYIPHYIGSFVTLEGAIFARNAALVRLHGAFANTKERK